MDLTNKSELVKYLKDNQLWAKKGLSQNFLVNRKVLDEIVEAGEIQPDNLIIEIGPGVGTLTGELVKKSENVIAVELDQKLAELLKSIPKLDVINADITRVDLNELIGGRKYKVIANIPYHITSQVLELFLSRENKPALMVLLVQKEVAQRACAKPGEMSTLSVSVQLYGEPKIIDIVKAQSFFPQPKVDSAILKIVTGNRQLTIDEKAFFRLIHVGFSSRRKTLENNLSAGYCISKARASDIIKKMRLNPLIRAQELSVSDWIKLFNLINF